MRQRIASTFCVLAFSGLLAGGALAQSPQKVSVPFKFHINNVAYEPGTYYVLQQAEGARLEIRDSRQKPLAQVPVLTRLSAKTSGAAPNNTRLVFDEVASERILSEVWMPGKDGYLVRATSEKHGHSVVPNAATGTP